MEMPSNGCHLMGKKERVVVVCPGRGTYNKGELGYLKKYHSSQQDFIDSMDSYRHSRGQPTISELDSAKRYRTNLHNTGDNASALIYTCALADFLRIDRQRYEIVAVTGNSMGWYLALACGGALNLENGMHLVNVMGTLMHDYAEGGQVIFSICNDQWQYDPSLDDALQTSVKKLTQNPRCEIHTSIRLGGMVVLAANKTGVQDLLDELPKVQDRYPFVLPDHGAFHSPLMKPVSERAKQMLVTDLMHPPCLPLIDGRGHIWQPYSTDLKALYKYTFEQQVCETYDYSKAIEVAAKEFAPDRFIVLGPGTTLGPPTAQAFINMYWFGLGNKDAFKDRQFSQPVLLSMGIEEQRQLTLAADSIY